jgi:endonuclease-8
MPEGDTIHRTAKTLTRALEGKKLVSGKARGVDLSGLTVSEVEARGKNLLVRFDDGSTLLTHMRMTGAWHIYKPGERWWKPAHLANAVLSTEQYVAVCFNAPVVELLRTRAEARDARLSGLGPDLLLADFDVPAAAARLRARTSELELGIAVMTQHAIAGIGNIYKSESLFLSKQSPFTPVSALSDEVLCRVLDTASKLMRATVETPRRSTRPGGGYWVYRRRGEACLHCGTQIEMKRQGEQRRSTYYCPECQRA